MGVPRALGLGRLDRKFPSGRDGRQPARMFNLSEPSGGSSHPRVPNGLAKLLQPAATEGLGVEGWGYHWHRGFAPLFVQKPPRFG